MALPDRHSRQQREAYSRRRKPMPMRVREGRQEAAGRKRPLRFTPLWLRDGRIYRDEDEQAIPHAVVRNR